MNPNPMPINLSQSDVHQLITETKKHSDYKQLTAEQRKAVKLIIENEKEGKGTEFKKDKDIKILRAAGIEDGVGINQVCTDLGKTVEKSKSPWYKRLGKGFANTFLGRVSSKELRSVVNQSLKEKVEELLVSVQQTPRPKQETDIVSLFFGSGPNLTRHERMLLAEIKAEARKKIADNIKQNPSPGRIQTRIAVLRLGEVVGRWGRDRWEGARISFANSEYLAIKGLPIPSTSPQAERASVLRGIPGGWLFSGGRREPPKLDKSTVLSEIKRAQDAELERHGINISARNFHLGLSA